MRVHFETEETAAERVRLEGMLRVRRMGHEYRLATLGAASTSDKIPPSLLSEMFPAQDPAQEFAHLLEHAMDPAKNVRFAKLFRKKAPNVPDMQTTRTYYGDEEIEKYHRLVNKNSGLYATRSEAYVQQQSNTAAVRDEIEALLRFNEYKPAFTMYLYLVAYPDHFSKFWLERDARQKTLTAMIHTHELVLALLKNRDRRQFSEHDILNYMSDNRLAQTLQTSAARISEKIRDDNHVPDFTSTMVDAPSGYMLDLYPYTAQAAVEYVLTAMKRKPQRWQKFGTDVRQKRLDALSRAAIAAFRLLVKLYGVHASPAASVAKQGELMFTCNSGGLRLGATDAMQIVQVLYYLQLPLDGRELVGEDVDPTVLRNVLHAFEQVFFTL